MECNGVYTWSYTRRRAHTINYITIHMQVTHVNTTIWHFVESYNISWCYFPGIIRYIFKIVGNVNNNSIPNGYIYNAWYKKGADGIDIDVSYGYVCCMFNTFSSFQYSTIRNKKTLLKRKNKVDISNKGINRTTCMTSRHVQHVHYSIQNVFQSSAVT